LRNALKAIYSVSLFFYAMEVYDKMAEYYDLIYGDEWDTEFYLNEARNARGKVLEVACGTGRILLTLARNNIDVTGLDLSEGMLQILNEKAKSEGIEVAVHHANMIDFKLEERFNLIIVPYRSFLHLTSDSERSAAIRNFMEHLNPGGRLILHTYNPSEEELEMSGEFHHYDTEEFSYKGKNLVLDWFLKYDSSDGSGSYRIVLNEEDGKSVNYEMKIYFITPKDIQRLLESAGYKNIRHYCGFDYSPFNETCREAVWIAER
jgi:2-polyprenyl-3-methyl-5-hydroxy-6-metoxy-1,4-benzoquinol methylase